MSYKTYENYKDSGVEWIGTIPEQWEVFKLKHVINEFVSGGTPKTSNDSFWDENNQGIPWVAIGDMSNKDFVDYTSKSLTIDGVANKNLRILPKGTLIYSIFASLGNVSILNMPATTNQAILGMLISKKIDKFYLKYYLEALREHIIVFSNANTQDNLNSTTVKNIDIALPTDVKEQEKIAKYLDKKTSEIDENIAKNKELISLLEEKKTALINQAVTKGLNPNVPMKDSGIEWIGEIPEHWVIKKLKYCVDLNSSSLSENTDDYYEFDYVDISSVSLEKGIEKYEHMYFKDSPSRARRIVKKDDIIVSTVRTYLKAIAVIPDKKDVIVSTGFAVLTPRNINSSFLAYLTKSNYFVNLVSAHSVGVSYPAINSSVLVNLKIVIPPTEEQEKCSDYLEKEISKIDEIIEKNNEEIELLEEYKTSLIHHVVTGKIDVRNVI